MLKNVWKESSDLQDDVLFDLAIGGEVTGGEAEEFTEACGTDAMTERRVSRSQSDMDRGGASLSGGWRT